MTDERDRLRVLVACAANVSRSSLAKRLLQRTSPGSAPVLDGDHGWVRAHRSRRRTAQPVAAGDRIPTVERATRVTHRPSPRSVPIADRARHAALARGPRRRCGGPSTGE